MMLSYILLLLLLLLLLSSLLYLSIYFKYLSREPTHLSSFQWGPVNSKVDNFFVKF